MIFLARHGETTWNVAGRYQGRLESPLSPLGVRQSEALARHLADAAASGGPAPQRTISSPLLRCTATAEKTATLLAIPCSTDERLIEIAHGTWEDRARDEIEKNDPARYRAWRRNPARVTFEGGESLAAVLERWRAFAPELRKAGNVLVVTHDAVIRCALVDLLGLTLDDFWKVKVSK